MDFVIFVVSSMVISVALGTLLHLQFGLTGIVNFGVVGFWGVGMYTMGVLLVDFEVPYLVALAAATLASGLLAFVLGRLILDLDGQAILVATLAFATIVLYLVTTEKWLTGGVIGLGTVPFPFDAGRSTELLFLGVLVVLAAALIWYARRVRLQPYGRLLIGIRENEPLARSLGKPTFRQKLVLFTITSAGMGFFGALSGSLNQFLVPRMLEPALTFTIWIALIVGGRKHPLGALIGVIVTVGLFDLVIETLAPIPETYAQLIPNLKLMIYGLTLIVVMTFRPQGIMGDGKRS